MPQCDAALHDRPWLLQTHPRPDRWPLVGTWWFPILKGLVFAGAFLWFHCVYSTFRCHRCHFPASGLHFVVGLCLANPLSRKAGQHPILPHISMENTSMGERGTHSTKPYSAMDTNWTLKWVHGSYDTVIIILQILNGYIYSMGLTCECTSIQNDREKLEKNRQDT